MRFLDYAPILHISALTGERAESARDDRQGRRGAPQARADAGAQQVRRGGHRRESAGQPGSAHVRILYAAQIGVAPPSFVFFTNVATTFHFSYERFLVNQLRERFGFVGTPIRIQVRRRSKEGGSGPRVSQRPRPSRGTDRTRQDRTRRKPAKKK